MVLLKTSLLQLGGLHELAICCLIANVMLTSELVNTLKIPVHFSPVMVPWTWVPFFSSMVTVSWLSFIKNLNADDQRHS